MVTIPGLVFLAASTSRSGAYAQVFAANGWAPSQLLVYGPEAPKDRVSPVWPPEVQVPEGLVVPDLSVSVEETARRHGWALESLPTDTVNAATVRDRLREISPRITLYSGRGGEIVERDILRAGGSFLHVHSGWLPEKRGSTTLHYAMLEDDDLGVSALKLDENIDTGPVFLRRRFPHPPAGVEVDHLYDGAIRAAVVAEVLEEVIKTGALPEPSCQPHTTTPYYVIHPVLKHLALLRVAKKQ